jgi:hypothetical protein
MSLVESFPPSALGSSAGQLAGANSWTGTNQFAGQLAANSVLKLGTQTFATSATISATGGVVIVYTGSVGQTLTLPAAPTTGQVFFVRSINPVGLNGNGANIDGLASASVGGVVQGMSVLWFDGTQWLSITPSSHGQASWNRTCAFTAIQMSGPLSMSGGWAFAATQSFSATGTISGGNSGPVWIVFSGGASQTLTLPASPNAGEVHVIKNASGNSLTLAPGSGQNLEGNTASVTMVAGASRIVAFNSTGSNWQIIGGYL